MAAVKLYAYLCPERHLTKIDSNQASDIFSELKRDKQGRLLSYVAGDFDCYEASRYTYDSTSGLLKSFALLPVMTILTPKRYNLDTHESRPSWFRCPMYEGR